MDRPEDLVEEHELTPREQWMQTVYTALRWADSVTLVEQPPLPLPDAA